MKLLSFVIAGALPIVSIAGVCNSGLYQALAPLTSYQPAQSYCSQRYPATTTTITLRGNVNLKRNRQSNTTSSSAGKTTTPRTTTLRTTTTARGSTPPATTSTTARASSTTARVIPQTTSPTTTKASTKDSKEVLWSSISAQAGAIISTFCSCINPPKTVTVTPTTTTTTTTTTASMTTTTSSQDLPAPTCGIACTVSSDTYDLRAAPQCASFANCNFCAINTLEGTAGTCQACAGLRQLCKTAADCCDATHQCYIFFDDTGFCAPPN